MNRRQVLVVEDEPELARLVEIHLRDAGYEVTLAHDGLSGLELAASHSFNCIILDLMLPGIDGLEVCSGYLYIVLASHRLDSVPGRLRNSYLLRLSTRNALAYLAVVLLSGVLAFGFLTRPLRRLAARSQSSCAKPRAAWLSG